ncbi:MAG: hypothetical protein ACRC8Q_04630, partial [Aeromonas sp.]
MKLNSGGERELFIPAARPRSERRPSHRRSAAKPLSERSLRVSLPTLRARRRPDPTHSSRFFGSNYAPRVSLSIGTSFEATRSGFD